MNLSPATGWWIAAGVLVAAELGTGTFYLLMLALGAVAGALAAHVGLGLSLQLLLAAIVGGGAVTGWYFKRRRDPAAPPTAANRDINIDIGEQIDVPVWNADGSASAMYRGARWAVRYDGAGTPRPGAHVIRRVEGNRLHVERKDNP